MLMTKPTTKNLNEFADELNEMRQKRDQEIRRLYTAYKEGTLTGWTIERIADEYGISKQRVWQIVEDIAKRYKDPD